MTIMNNEPSDKDSLTLTEYLQWIKECYNKLHPGHRPLFFIGHPNGQWDLLPTVLRNPLYDERGIILDYKQAFVAECDYLSYMERMLTEMQHHLIPTRLLDWSVAPLTALYFACSDREYPDKDAKIYALNPWDVYRSLKPKGSPTYHFEIMRQSRLCSALNWTFEEIAGYISRKFNYEISSRELEQPLPIVGRYMDDRVRSQQGCFTLWGTDKRSLDHLTAYKSNLATFEVPSKDKPAILESLSLLGINEFTLFSDREGLSKMIMNYGSYMTLHP